MKERPMLFSAQMVRAILAGHKTQTRRVVKPQLSGLDLCPYGQAGDRLWVREAWATDCMYDDVKPSLLDCDSPIYYPATREWSGTPHVGEGRGRPSIHMPRWASRITLEVVRVGVERLQEITVADCRAEGFSSAGDDRAACIWYEDLWADINGPGSWDENPFVRVVEFKLLGGAA